MSPCLSSPSTPPLTFRESYLNKLDSERAFCFEIGIEAALFFNKLVSERFQFQHLVADTQQTPEIVAEEPAVEQVTPEPVLRRSSSTIRVPDMYVPSLHYLLLMKGNQSPLMRPYSWRIQPSGSKSWMMGRLGFKNVLYRGSVRSNS